MPKKIKYSWWLNDWVIDQIPVEIRKAMRKTGWNVFGIYELIKEGMAAEKKYNQSLDSDGKKPPQVS